jgi:(1->4)-alpha-D-glucan 1-alpha-D-glucosylmutase
VVGILEHQDGLMTEPMATYRLQLTADFGFRAAAAIAPYLRRLGVTHVYASPILQSRRGSTHGYDMVDPTRIDEELGGEEGFAQLVAALRAEDLGLIVDFVPNHMGVLSPDNPWWLDVLEWGRASPHARDFDIEWNALRFDPRDKLLLPVLGRSYAAALDAGEIELRYDAAKGSFSAWYYAHRLPIVPRCYRGIVEAAVRHADDPPTDAGRALLDHVRARGRPGHPTYPEAGGFKRALAAIAGGAQVITAGLAFYRPGGPGGSRALHRLLEAQAYRLGYWRLAGSQTNYRRFFDINSLAGLRIEDARTFEEVHVRIAPLIAAGAITGLRLDHIDGLADPAGYCRRLRDLIARLRPDAGQAFPVFVEKILADGEAMPRLPGVAGTTGYEWLNVIQRVLVDTSGLATLDRVWQEASGERRAFPAILEQAKREALEKLFASEFNTVSRLLARIAAGNFRTRDFAEERLRAALARFIVQFPVYRTYVTADGAGEADRVLIARVIHSLRAGAPPDDGPILDFLRDVLTLDLVAAGRGGHSRVRTRRFVRKLQQLTGPVTAKALEDTAFYRFHRLIALNEVGGDPAADGIGIDEFHRRMRERVVHGAGSLTATATHDTKRGEDARARILALSELPDEWAAAVAQWRAANARHVQRTGGRRSPSAGLEYKLYQGLIGAWPRDRDVGSLRARFQAYAQKAAREAKQETSWLDPDQDYEAGVARFIEAILADTAFVASLDALAQRLALLGALNTLTQLALKAAMPGVPDFYQGTELWDLSLVDPDNRRPVDFAARAQALDRLGTAPDWPALAASWHDGRVKLALTWRLLGWRRALGAAFAHGDYRPLAVEGPHRERVIAFARVHGEDAAILVAGRHFAAVTDGGRRWPRPEDWDGHIVLGGLALERAAHRSEVRDRIALAQLFDAVPIAMLRARVRDAVAVPSM